MAFYVNSDAGNIFAYPNGRATPPEKMKVNGAADSFWRGVVDNSLPFVLTDAGKSNPKDADEPDRGLRTQPVRL
jgi:hypothetical protein